MNIVQSEGIFIKGILVLFAMWFVSCETKPSVSIKEQASRNVLRINLEQNVVNLHPLHLTTGSDKFIGQLLYEGLYTKTAFGTLKRALAENVKYDSASQQYIFSLNKRKLFENNENLSTTHIYTCFKNLIDANTDNRQILLFRENLNGYNRYAIRKQYGVTTDSLPSGFRIIDDSHFGLTWDGNIRQLLSILSEPEFWIYKLEEGTDNISGTGPFIIEHANSDISYSLAKNELYKSDDLDSDLPYLEGISIRFIKDDEAKINEFLNGSLDILEFDPGWNGNNNSNTRLGGISMNKYGSHKITQSNTVHALAFMAYNIHDENLRQMIKFSMDTSSVSQTDTIAYFANRFFFNGKHSKIRMPIVAKCPSGCSSTLTKIVAQLKDHFDPIISRFDRLNPNAPYIVLEERQIVINDENPSIGFEQENQGNNKNGDFSYGTILEHKPIYVFSNIMLEGIKDHSDWSRSIPYLRFIRPRILSKNRL